MNVIPSSLLPIVIVPELFRTVGGVQTFSQNFIFALDAIYGRPVAVISSNDRNSDFPEDFKGGREIYCYGEWPPILRRLGIIISTLKSRGTSILTTHPNYTRWLRMQSRPYFSVVHGIDVWQMDDALKKGVSSAAHLLAVSQYTLAQVRSQLGANTPSATVLSNTFDEQRFYPGIPKTNWRTHLNISKNDKVLLSVCRVSKTEEKKGFFRVLELLPNLLELDSNIVWVLGGAGDALDDVKKRAKELNVYDACRFTGYIADAEIVDLYRSVDLFVLPSQKEGFGIVFLEAAATGLPVIAGNQDGSVDALANGELGSLIPPDDSIALKTEILRVLRSNKIDPLVLHEKCAQMYGKKEFRKKLESILVSQGILSVKS